MRNKNRLFLPNNNKKGRIFFRKTTKIIEIKLFFVLKAENSYKVTIAVNCDSPDPRIGRIPWRDRSSASYKSETGRDLIRVKFQKKNDPESNWSHIYGRNYLNRPNGFK